jgi:uncharacterized protein
MPVNPTFPGVYIEEIPSGVRTITGVATSITAFVGRTLTGPASDNDDKNNRAVTINSYADFERIYGGLWSGSTLGYAVRDFFLNGGNQAIIVRLYHSTIASESDARAVSKAVQAVAEAAAQEADNKGATAQSVMQKARESANTFTTDPAKTAADTVAKAAEAEAAKADATPASVSNATSAAANQADSTPRTFFAVAGLALVAAYPGSGGQYLRASVDYNNITPDIAIALGVDQTDVFNLTVHEEKPGGRSERYQSLTLGASLRRIDKVLAADSRLILWDSLTTDLTQDQQVQQAQQTMATARKNLLDAQDAVNKAKGSTDTTALQKALQALATAQAALEDPVTVAEADVADKARTLAEKQKALDLATKGGDSAAIKQATQDRDAAKTALQGSQTTLQQAIDAMQASDGGDLVEDDFTGTGRDSAKTGLFALVLADLFNILCIPPYIPPAKSIGGGWDVDSTLITDAAVYCEQRRAMLLVDPPSAWIDKDTAKTQFLDPTNDVIGTRSQNAALFFPRFLQPDPLRNNQVRQFVPCGAVAGIFARTDTQRGVWKAPAGLDASLNGVPQLAINLSNAENGELNPLGINCLRAFPASGRVVWGSRTLQGNDSLASEWKYIPVRRTALFIEESLYRGTQWVVFEPNDEPLWAQIRLNVGAFMQNLFRQGAFQGQTPKDAYFVKCDKETTTQNDINLGIVNIVVGFAPLKPAEFVIIQLQQMAGQVQS